MSKMTTASYSIGSAKISLVRGCYDSNGPSEIPRGNVYSSDNHDGI